MVTLTSTILRHAWQRLSRPIITLMIKNGVMYQEFMYWCKCSYVDVAEAHFGKRGRPTNQSRVALLTGLDRKEIKRLRDAREKMSETSASDRPASDRLGRVLSGWHQDTRFARDGQPQVLSVDEGFADLCKEYGGDVPNSTILKELEEGGAVQRQADGRVLAVSRYYMPAPTDPTALSRSADVYRDIGETLLHNLYRAPNEPSRFEGRASNLRIAKRHADDFRAFVEKRGQAFLEDVDQWLSETEAQTHEDDETLRLGIGLYYVQDEDQDDA